MSRSLTLRLGLVVVAALAVLGMDGAKARAASPEQIAAALRSRLWYEDFGSFGTQIVGRVYSFGAPAGGGWYTGEYVTFKGLAGTGTRLGMAWKPITDGVILDFGFRVETVRFTGFAAATETFTFRASDGRSGRWSSTRSPLTPIAIRRLYYR